MYRAEGLAKVRAHHRKAVHIAARHEFKGFNQPAGAFLQAVQQGQGIGQAACRQRGGGMGAGLWHQFHDGGGDDAQRPFCPDEQRFQIVAGVVLVQFAHQVQHAAVGQNHLQSQAQRAGGPVAQNV